MSESNPPAFEIHSGLILKGQLSMVKDITLTGRFEGDLQTLGCVTVAPGGVVIGTIDAGGLVLKEGYVVEGSIKVGAPPKPVDKQEGDAGQPLFSGFKRGFQKLKELAMGRA